MELSVVERVLVLEDVWADLRLGLLMGEGPLVGEFWRAHELFDVVLVGDVLAADLRRLHGPVERYCLVVGVGTRLLLNLWRLWLLLWLMWMQVWLLLLFYPDHGRDVLHHGRIGVGQWLVVVILLRQLRLRLLLAWISLRQLLGVLRLVSERGVARHGDIVSGHLLVREQTVLARYLLVLAVRLTLVGGVYAPHGAERRHG